MIFIFLSESFRSKETKQKTFWISEPLVLDEHQSQFFMPESPGEPEFADSETNVTAQLGGSVFLHCPVINSGDRAVSYPSVSILKKMNEKGDSFISRHDWHFFRASFLLSFAFFILMEFLRCSFSLFLSGLKLNF